MRVLVFILFSLLTFESYCQTERLFSFENEIETEIDNKIQNVKDRLSCNYFDSIAFQTIDTFFCNFIDTSLFNYIPVVKNINQFKNDSIEIKSIITEILLFEVKTKSIIGTAKFSKNNAISLYFSRSQTLNLPFRLDDRLCCYLPQQYYLKASDFVKNQKNGFFSYNEFLDTFFFISSKGKPKVLCK